ncbi:alpha/beta hydrolase family protein [Saccharolobus shibatae]|uniref:Serine aminopeptidase S33 domain-containing protein n=1 Tax=Saccharolobus shibatae TaxID=2286 RepID=A0A8F5BYR6_9CREN|nr:alpha/beta fold hydrolase [Saccharolobus shibatae]QXJ33948.1 hypothetical protein J5U22_00493 [Saccharolobus shibatae]
MNESPLLIMFHGFTGNHIEAGRLFSDLAINLCNAGITTIRFDYRGHGDSYGLFDEAFSIKNALEDSEYVVNYAIKMGFSKIGFLGFSLGGEMALLTFKKFRNAINAFVLVAPVLSAEGPRSNWILNQDGYRYSPFGPFRLRDEIIGEMKVNLMHIADEINVPILIAHSKDDEVLDFRFSMEFYNQVKFTDKQILLFDKGGHIFYDYEVRQRLYKEVTEWLIKRLK